VTSQTLCPSCASAEYPANTRCAVVVIGGVTHSIPEIWLAGSTTARAAVVPRRAALALFRDAIEAWAEQCTARAEHGL
jgi:hypothetical protein